MIPVLKIRITRISLAWFVLLLVTATACKKNQLGGDARIHGVVSHHSKPIAFATVYIKFGAKESPGTDVSKYDTHVSADQQGKFELTCYKGDYFLFGTGIDYLPNATTVSGGTPAHIRSKETLSLTVPVTE